MYPRGCGRSKRQERPPVAAPRPALLVARVAILRWPMGVAGSTGGKSTGPVTAPGLERSRKARRTHGLYSRETIAARQEARILTRALAALVWDAK